MLFESMPLIVADPYSYYFKLPDPPKYNGSAEVDYKEWRIKMLDKLQTIHGNKTQ